MFHLKEKVEKYGEQLYAQQVNLKLQLLFQSAIKLAYRQPLN